MTIPTPQRLNLLALQALPGFQACLTDCQHMDMSCNTTQPSKVTGPTRIENFWQENISDGWGSVDFEAPHWSQGQMVLGALKSSQELRINNPDAGCYYHCTRDIKGRAQTCAGGELVWTVRNQQPLQQIAIHLPAFIAHLASEKF